MMSRDHQECPRMIFENNQGSSQIIQDHSGRLLVVPRHHLDVPESIVCRSSYKIRAQPPRAWSHRATFETDLYTPLKLCQPPRCAPDDPESRGKLTQDKLCFSSVQVWTAVWYTQNGLIQIWKKRSKLTQQNAFLLCRFVQLSGMPRMALIDIWTKRSKLTQESELLLCKFGQPSGMSKIIKDRLGALKNILKLSQ